MHLIRKIACNNKIKLRKFHFTSVNIYKHNARNLKTILHLSTVIMESTWQLYAVKKINGKWGDEDKKDERNTCTLEPTIEKDAVGKLFSYSYSPFLIQMLPTVFYK